MTGVLLYFEDETGLALRLAEAAGLEARRVECHRFPDGELRLRLPEVLPQNLVVLRGLQLPNDKLIELLLVARSARQRGVHRIVLVCPYLAYMRQDMAFAPGEVVSQQVIGGFLAGLFDAVLTVDPHLHRVSSLAEVMPGCQAIALSGAPLLAELVGERRPDALLLGPDGESAQWVSVAAAHAGLDHAVCTKVRHGDCEVAIELPRVPLAGRKVVLVDDVASSGHTLAVAARLALQAGAVSVDVAVTHALFAGVALQNVQDAGVGEIWSTDSVAHSTNVVSVAPMFACALDQLHRGGR